MMSSADPWKKRLTPEQYRVLREKATEAPYSGTLLRVSEKGIYTCAGCGSTLFKSDTKFDAGCGWPSFYDVYDSTLVALQRDDSHGMERTEVVCRTCGGHLGHLFDDAPEQPTGLRYCINSVALDFIPEHKP